MNYLLSLSFYKTGLHGQQKLVCVFGLTFYVLCIHVGHFSLISVLVTNITTDFLLNPDGVNMKPVNKPALLHSRLFAAEVYA